MNERDTSPPDCKHKHMMQKTELNLTNLCPVPSVKYRINISRLSHFDSWFNSVF